MYVMNVLCVQDLKLASKIKMKKMVEIEIVINVSKF